MRVSEVLTSKTLIRALLGVDHAECFTTHVYPYISFNNDFIKILIFVIFKYT